MSREAHVRSCERLWVKLPGPTRPSGETREIPPKRKVGFLSLGMLRQLESVTFSDDINQTQAERHE
jgi:hypothetical protein